MITEVVAAYGAIVSTIYLIREFRKDRPKAMVQSGISYLYQPRDKEASSFAVAGAIANTGSLSIYLSRIEIETDRGTAFGGVRGEMSESLPTELKPGQGHSVKIPIEVAYPMSGYGDHRRIRVVYYDQTGKRYSGPLVMIAMPEKSSDGWTLNPPPPPGRISEIRRRLTGVKTTLAKHGAKLLV